MKRASAKASKSVSQAGRVSNGTATVAGKTAGKDKVSWKRGAERPPSFLLFPRAGVVSGSRNRRPRQEVFVTVVDRVVGFVSCAD